jgi:hypothetical protein
VLLRVSTVKRSFYEGAVYNYEVEDDHSYTLSRFVVHNCYDPLDRFLVLSDVAPASDAYSHYKSIVETWNKAGLLNREWQDKYQEALYQVDMRFKPPFEEPRFSPTALQEKSVVIDDILAPTRFRAGGQMYQLAGVEPDVERQAWLARSQGKDANLMMRRYAQVKTKLAALEGKTVTIRTGAQGMESAAPAIVPGINTTALSLGLGKEITSAADAQAKFSGNIIERLWDKARHVQIPDPLLAFLPRYAAGVMWKSTSTTLSS